LAEHARQFGDHSRFSPFVQTHYFIPVPSLRTESVLRRSPAEEKLPGIGWVNNRFPIRVNHAENEPGRNLSVMC